MRRRVLPANGISIGLAASISSPPGTGAAAGSRTLEGDEDAREFIALAPQVPVRTTTTPYPLERANEAVADMRAGRLEGAAVLEIRK